MTLIEVRGGGDNHLIGRCDARCYNAEHPDCDCICGGRNHSAGKAKAKENTAAMADKMIQEFKERKGLKDTEDLINLNVFQSELFKV